MQYISVGANSGRMLHQRKKEYQASTLRWSYEYIFPVERQQPNDAFRNTDQQDRIDLKTLISDLSAVTTKNLGIAFCTVATAAKFRLAKLISCCRCTFCRRSIVLSSKYSLVVMYIALSSCTFVCRSQDSLATDTAQLARRRF
jgi:hypothetical protein